MKKNIFPFFFIFILLFFCIFYIKNIFFNNFDFDNKKNIFIYNKFLNIKKELAKYNNDKFKTLKDEDKKYKSVYITTKNVFLDLSEKSVKNGDGDNNIINYIDSFNKYLTKNNINFIYIDPPFKNSFYYDELEKYDYYNDIDNYIEKKKQFSEKDINYISANEVLRNSEISADQLFYKTEYHWTLEAGLYFTNELVDRINNDYNYQLDKEILNKDNFLMKTYKNSYYGYYARFFGADNKYSEDFTYYIPKTKTSFKINTLNQITEGDIGKIYNTDFSKKDIIEKKEYIYNNIVGGTGELVQITNMNSDNNKKVLLIGDSYTKAMTPFLSLVFNNIDIMDLRFNSNENNIINYLEKNKPDLVLILNHGNFDKLNI